MLSAVPLADSSQQLGALVAVVTAGQMTGKSVMYWTARRSPRPPGPRLQAFLDRSRARLQHQPGSLLSVTFISSMVGLPPFYLVTLAAGILHVAFGRFLVVGTLGRLIHFGLVACLPQLAWKGL
jgi:membrane protein YqaA with SNARE-associated domain